MNAPFQLVDYQNERSKQIDDLDRQAKTTTGLGRPRRFRRIPRTHHRYRQPALLWPALALTDDLLTTALRCKVTAIHSLDVHSVITNVPAPESMDRWDRNPLAGGVYRFGRQRHPIHPEPAPARRRDPRGRFARGRRPDKAPLFIDRLIVRKQSPDKPDEVRVWLRAVGFVLRE